MKWQHGSKPFVVGKQGLWLTSWNLREFLHPYMLSNNSEISMAKSVPWNLQTCNIADIFATTSSIYSP